MGGPRVLRAMNDRAALYALLQSGPLSRIELEREIGLSKPAAAELLRRLERADLVRRAGHQDTGAPGPNAQLWEVNAEAGYAAGVDVSASGFDVAVADLSGRVVAEHRVSARGTAADPVRSVRAAVLDAARSRKIAVRDLRRVVVGISGSIDPGTGFLEYAGHMRPWHGFDVQARLTAALEVPVTVENDVNLVAVDEWLHGCAQGYRDVLLLWMSRGVAAAVIIGGRLHRGFRGGAGEIDLVPIGPDGHAPGNLLENARVLELAAEYGIRASRGPTAVRRAAVALEHPAVSLNPSEQTAGAENFLGALADRMAQSLIGPVAMLDPELVVLAGDIGLAGGDRLASRVADRLHRMSAHRPEVRHVTGRLGSVRDGAVGAAVRQLRELVFGSPVEEVDPPTGQLGNRHTLLASTVITAAVERSGRSGPRSRSEPLTTPLPSG